jgi:flagellar biosynthesis protein FliR
MNLIIGLLILALLVSMLAAMWVDVTDACHEAFLDELWDEDE